MINVQLREQFGEKQIGNLYGVVTNMSDYSGYPVMVVNNMAEAKDGKYTHNSADCLVHLSKDVRTYARLKLYSDYLYQNTRSTDAEKGFHMFEYKKTELTDEEIIRSLMNVLYFLEPSLQSRTCLGTTKKGIENDPNRYTGRYVLNDEKEYTIEKYRNKYTFLKGKDACSSLEDKDYVIQTGEIDFPRYKKALEMARLKTYIIRNVNKIISSDDDSIEKYKKLVKELKEEA